MRLSRVFLVLAVLAAVSGLAVAEQRVAEQGRSIPELIEDFAQGHDGGAREAYAKVVEVGKPAIPYLAEVLRDGRKNVRWIAVEALGAIGGEEAVQPLLRALGDEDKDVRRYAAYFLGQWGLGNQDVPAALRKAVYDCNLEVAWHVMSALDRLGDTSYRRDHLLVDALCRHLEGADDERRENAARALGMMGSARACAPLVRALSHPDTTPNSRRVIGESLARIGSRDAVPFLVGLLADETKEGQVRWSAVGPLRALADPSVNSSLVRLTESPEWWLREAAVAALGFKDNRSVVTRLAELARDKTEYCRVRERAAESLGRIGDARAVPALAEALTAEDERVRRKAAWALGEINSGDAVPLLMEALDDPVCYVTMYAAQSLGKIGDKRAASAIVELFDRQNALEVVASNPAFANIATVAHHALREILKQEVSDDRRLSIATAEELRAIREAWRIKLGLEQQE